MSLIGTRIQHLRANSNFDKYELRRSQYGAWDAFRQMSDDPTGIITDELRERAFESVGATGDVLETPVINYDGTITIGNTRSVTIADSENNSAMLQITFSTYAWGFTIAPAMYLNNEIKIQKDFEFKFLKYLYLFADTLDTACVSALEAGKTQIVGGTPLNYTWDNTNKEVDATWAQRYSIVGDLNPLMHLNDFYDQLHVIGNPSLESLVRQLAQSDLYNAVNKRNEWQDKIFHFTNNISNPSGAFSLMYAVNGGSLGILTRVERESRLRSRSGDGHEWGETVLPIVNIPVGTYYYDTVADLSSLAGDSTSDMTRARKEAYGFAVDVAIVKSYNSAPTTIPQPILRVNLATGSDSSLPNVAAAATEANAARK